MERHVIIGPPGTGKTTRLLELVHAEDCNSDEIGYFAYTRKAANEAKERLKLESDIPYFRTLHSLCYRQLGLSFGQVFKDSHLRDFGKQLGERFFTSRSDNDGSEDYYSLHENDRIIRILHLARNQLRPISEVVSDLEGAQSLPMRKVIWIRDSLMQYKKVNELYDFTDMLEVFLARGRSPLLRRIYLDEGQDLTRLQWLVVEKLLRESGAEKFYTAGDDDQAIFAWNGACVDTFINLPGRAEVLGRSYRVPGAVQSVAAGLLGRIVSRRPKHWAPRPEEGLVCREFALEGIPFHEGKWYVLARNAYHLSAVRDYLKRNSYLYEWRGKLSLDQEMLDAVRAWERRRKSRTPEIGDDALIEKFAIKGAASELPWWDALHNIAPEDRVYLRTALAQGEKLDHPRIRLSTIHGAKGGEAERVLLLTDLSRNSQRSYERDPDSELRVFYVGATRAKEELYLLDGPARDHMVF